MVTLKIDPRVALSNVTQSKLVRLILYLCHQFIVSIGLEGRCKSCFLGLLDLPNPILFHLKQLPSMRILQPSDLLLPAGHLLLQLLDGHLSLGRSCPVGGNLRLVFVQDFVEVDPSRNVALSCELNQHFWRMSPNQIGIPRRSHTPHQLTGHLPITDNCIGVANHPIRDVWSLLLRSQQLGSFGQKRDLLLQRGPHCVHDYPQFCSTSLPAWVRTLGVEAATGSDQVLHFYQPFVFSDWAKVVLICKYVEKPSWQKFVCVDKVLEFLCCHRITKSWHGKIGQYSLLSSCNYKSWNLGYKLTWGLVDKTVQGEKAYDLIKLPEGVKRAVLDSLISNNGRVANGKLSLERNEVIQQLAFALDLETTTHTIMVWHIATSLCEIELLKNWWSPQSFFVDIKDLEGELRGNYEIAASLSRYCAYLVVYNDRLVADPHPAVEYIFGNIILEARNLLGDHGSLKSKYEKLMAEQAPSETIIAKSSELGKQLIEIIQNDEKCWKVLADFWAEWILYMAPSRNTEPHEISLQKGCEFMTQLWALLSHAGIFDRPDHEAPDSSV